MRTFRSIPSATALLCLASLLAAAPATAATGAEIVSYVNAQRAANGIPAGITERPDWSQSCADHNRYMDQNGGVTHDEDASMPGYTKNGAWAGQNSVLTDIGDWTPAQNPFETAPIHLAQLLGPDLVEMGADQYDGYTCATTYPGYTRPAPAAVTGYSYPGNGTSGVAAGEVAAEAPFTPGELVGLPAGTETGPYLMAFLDGPAKIHSATVSAASLTGPDGAVAIESIGSDNSQIGPYLPAPMAFLIPRAPLADGTYHASVSFTYSEQDDARRVLVHGWPAARRRPRFRRRQRLRALRCTPRSAAATGQPSFAFELTGATGFECKLDRAAWKACTSPTTYKRVAAGRHTFRVRATGATSKAPTSFRFRIA